MADVAICAIFHNESPYLKEWIEYHRLLGIRHFYLYNDRSSDNYQEVLAPYVESGLVFLEDCHLAPNERHFLNQRRAYVRGLNRACEQWVAFIDLDEFIVPKQVDTIEELVEPYKDDLGVFLHWRKFGTSGYWDLPQNASLIEALTYASHLTDEDNQITKSIIQISKLPKEFFNEEYVILNQVDVVHFMRWPVYCGQKMRPLGPIFHDGCTQKRIDPLDAQINHYWCRTERYYRYSKVERKSKLLHEDFGKPYPWTDQQIERYISLYNLVEEHSIQRFVGPLKECLGIPSQKDSQDLLGCDVPLNLPSGEMLWLDHDG